MSDQLQSSSTPPLHLLFVGTGGQGVLTMARFLCDYLVSIGQRVVSGQLHGMAQRGGSVQATVSINSGNTPVIRPGRANYLIALEPLEAVRALPFCSKDTRIFINRQTLVPYVISQDKVRKREMNYPSLEQIERWLSEISQNIHQVDDPVGQDSPSNSTNLNLLMLGCLFGHARLCSSPMEVVDGFQKWFPPRAISAITRAFNRGYEIGSGIRTEGEK